jgi:hypothetical protein
MGQIFDDLLGVAYEITNTVVFLPTEVNHLLIPLHDY